MYMYYIMNYTKCRYLNLSSTLNTYHSKSYVFLYPWYSKTTNSNANFYYTGNRHEINYNY